MLQIFTDRWISKGIPHFLHGVCHSVNMSVPKRNAEVPNAILGIESAMTNGRPQNQLTAGTLDNNGEPMITDLAEIKADEKKNALLNENIVHLMIVRRRHYPFSIEIIKVKRQHVTKLDVDGVKT